MNKYILKLLLLPFLLSGCSESRLQTDGLNSEPNSGEIRITAEIDQVNITRADDSGFADADVIGVFAVDYDGTQPGQLQTTGNNTDNLDFTFDESSYKWVSSKSILFKDDKTPLDIYGYYPYAAEIKDIANHSFTVAINQTEYNNTNGMSGYEASDFLFAKAGGITSASPNANLVFKHIMASVRITLNEGDGFDDGEWNQLDKIVTVDNTSRNATINLSTGEVTSDGKKDNTKIVAKQNVNEFRAIVVPQSVSSGEVLLTISVGGHNYKFVRNSAMTYLQGKLHNFTIEVTKNTSGGDYEFAVVDESITAWESDSDSHGGEAKEYVCVHVESGQSLESALADAGISYNDVKNLKISGIIKYDDFYFIRDHMTKIQALNLKEATTSSYQYSYSIPEVALANRTTLRHVVLPDNLQRIEMYAFGGTILEGSLTIPDGVKYIGDGAFSNYFDEGSGHSLIPGGKLLANNNLTGTLQLPDGLEHIGCDAFRQCDFTGTLKLPHSLKYVGNNAFQGCRHFTGEIHFPDNLTEIEGISWSNYFNDGAFFGMTGIKGDLELPKNLKTITGFGGINVTNVLFSENAVEIGAYAFMHLNVKSGIVIPESVVSIGKYAFTSCNAPYIKIPESVTRIAEGSFANCQNLADTLNIPVNVEVIEDRAFYNCPKISALNLPAKLTYIADYAFKNCFSLEYIHCHANQPPTLSENAFEGIAKDNFTLEVPEGSVDAYRNAPGWCEFKRIAAYRGFVARPSKYNVLNKGGIKDIVLNADADWEMTDCPSWCHVDKKSGSKKTSIRLTVDAMAKGSPTRAGKIRFRLKGSTEYSTDINVCQYDYEYDEDSCLALQKASKGKGIDIFILGDGYDAADISSGMMMDDMRQTMEYLFAVEPYITYRDYFNIYTGVALSEDSGVEELNRWRNTKFHTVVPKTCGQRISADYASAINYCAEIFPSAPSVQNSSFGVILLPNFTGYDGITYMLGDQFCSIVTKSTEPYPMDARGLVQHEAGGHGIGWLADEYIYHSDLIQRCKCSCCEHDGELLDLQKSGFGRNVSLNGKYREVGWSHLIFNPIYADIVDIYEGGYFHQRGVFRSEYNSCMNNNVPYFSTWSRQLIVQRIMKLSGEQFSLEKFYANDKRDMGRDFTTSRSSVEEPGNIKHCSSPVFIKNFVLKNKKGGKR